MIGTQIYRKVIFATFVVCTVLAICLRFPHLRMLDLGGFAVGFGWMLYNIFGYFFDRDMSMRGKITFSNDSDVKSRRTMVFVGSIIIYCLLMLGLMRI